MEEQLVAPNCANVLVTKYLFLFFFTTNFQVTIMFAKSLWKESLCWHETIVVLKVYVADKQWEREE